MIRLKKRIVEKPWGRTDIPRAFGDLRGRRIGEIWFEDPAGDAAALMVKFLFTSQRLSIQVHPDNEAAQAAGLPRGKDECWLVLDASEDAEIGVGLRKPIDAGSLRRAALDGTIEDLINWRRAAAGDFLYNPAGVLHALGPGLTLVEVQQNLDCTYRLYDYGRDRELHLDQGLALAALDPHRDPRDTRVEADDSRCLVDGPYFHLLHLSGPQAATMLPPTPERFLFVPLSAGCSLCGEAVDLGECVATDRADSVSLDEGARALLCWPTNPPGPQVAP